MTKSGENGEEEQGFIKPGCDYWKMFYHLKVILKEEEDDVVDENEMFANEI